MKISKENVPASKQADSRHRPQSGRSDEQLEDAGAKFSSALKEPKSGEAQSKKGERDKRQDDNPFDRAESGRYDGVREKSHRGQQTKRSGEQLDDAEAKFSSALKEPKGGEAQSKKGERDKRQDDSLVDGAGSGRGEGIIANSDNIRAETPAVAKITQEAPLAHDVNSIAQQIATRILVSPPGAANPEVRIQLKESVLQGSDVRVFREGDTLKIVFVASSQEAANFISGNRDTMVAALSNRLPGEQIDVSVETKQAERERGEHGDGRSRQQYVADDDADAPSIER